jgi:hypothetical protein
MYLLLVARMAMSSPPLASRLTFELSVADYLFKRNVLTISDEDGDKLAAPGLQADFSVICDGLFIQAECAYYW